MPLQATSGAASYDAFGGGVAVVPNYIEDVFSTWLYTGNGSTQTINNGIDLAGKGGLVWTKSRRSLASVQNHHLYDTARGAGLFISSNLTSAQTNLSDTLSAFNSNGFSLGSNVRSNEDEETYASWTFRKQPKFFDVVTYTGNGTSQNIAHSLGSVPGCIIVKDISNTRAWSVYHTSLGNTQNLILSGTNAAATAADWNNTTPTSTQFTVGTSVRTNASGATYVAYLFAHDSGGFGLSGTDNVITCGSFTTDGSGIIPTVNLGYEPQWILAKPSSGTGNWFIMDNMRGWYNQQADQGNALFPNTSGAEAVGYNAMIPTATGFTGPNVNFGAGVTYIYIAIRRGPMRTPTTGTSVFSAIKAYNATGTKNTTDFPVDLQITKNFVDGGSNNVNDRLRGVSSISTESSESGPFLDTNSTAAEVLAYRTLGWDNTGFKTPSNYSNYDFIYWNFRRAPGFFDVVCYTGTGVARTVAHNLGVAPELMIVKDRTSAYPWDVYQTDVGAGAILQLNTIGAKINTGAVWNSTAPTASVFSIGTNIAVNTSGNNYVAYLFASCPGVSKVFSYTGNGSSQTINCGFTGGARFVMIKRTDSTGDWYVWDTARGIVANNDPHLSLNSTAAEVTTNDTIDTDSTGFVVNQVAATNVNVSSATYIGLAIA